MTSPLVQTARRVLAPTYRQPDVVSHQGTKAAGSKTRTASATSIMTTGIAVTALGHGSPVGPRRARCEAARGADAYLQPLLHSPGDRARRAALVEHSFATTRVFLCNSGHRSRRGRPQVRTARGRRSARHRLLRRVRSTAERFGALAATDREEARGSRSSPSLGGFRRAPYDDDDRADGFIDDRVAAVIVEPIQGEGGRASPPRTEWLQRASAQRCDEVGALLIVDEIQCGLGPHRSPLGAPDRRHPARPHDAGQATRRRPAHGGGAARRSELTAAVTPSMPRLHLRGRARSWRRSRARCSSALS